MNRRRSKERRDFPPNLYENNGYFSWRNPITDEYTGFGTNKREAFAAAIQCNIKIAQRLGTASLVEKAFGSKKHTVAAWEEKYQQILAKRTLTAATRSNYRSFGRHVVRMLGAQKALKSVTALDISESLEELADTLPGVAKSVRAYMKLSFAEAFVQGWLDANPVRETRIAAPPPVKRARLTLEVLMRVYADARPWLKNAIALALTSGQRREDVARAEFKDFRDGFWWCTQASEKTDHPHHIRIPLDLKPTGFPLSLGDVLAQCRRTGIVSRYLIHQTEGRRGRSKRGNALRLSTVTKAFTDAVEALGIDWGKKTPPTFHEIRSLSERLYDPQGVDTQTLLGHSDKETTALYHSSRGHEWETVGLTV